MRDVHLWRSRAMALFGALALLLSMYAAAHALPDVDTNLGGFEPTTAVVNPLNPDNVVVAQGNQVAISTNFGADFPITTTFGTPPTLPGYGFRGDPSITFDSQGRLFATYLMGLDGDQTVVVQEIDSVTGAMVGNAIDLAPGVNSDDKNWMAADGNPTSPFSDNIYVVWTRLEGNWSVMFTRSTDGGATWSAPQTISDNATDVNPWPTHVAVAPNGDVYVAYHNGACEAEDAEIVVLRDSTGGADFVAGNSVQRTSFPSGITCNRQDTPGTIPGAVFWTIGARAPYVLPDPVRPGNIYVVTNDDPDDDFSSGDSGDVILARSTDFGNNWSIQTIDHSPAGTLQVFPTGAIDQDGNIAVFWYDNRNGATNAAGNFLLDVYATVSRDGGLTFTNDFQINDVAFDPDLNANQRFPGPPPTLRIGEYNGIAAADGVAYVSWTGNDAGGNQEIFFDVFSILGAFGDRFEPNNSIDPGIATDLGAHASYSEPGLTIHTDTDEDFFKVTAQSTGKLDIQIGMTGRIVDLDLQVQDAFGNVIQTSVAGPDTNDVESIIIPAVAGQSYFARVFAEPGQIPAINTYNLNITNTAAPVPFGIDLLDVSDSGRSQLDNVTNVTLPTIRLRVDESPLQGLDFSPANGTGALDDDDPGYKVEVLRNGDVAGYAEPLAAQPGIYQFAFNAGLPLSEEENFITARVVIIDETNPPDGPHAVGRGSEANALLVTLDTQAPATPLAPDLDAASDSGGLDDDDVTTFSSPKFVGSGEANALVRLYANGLLVGQSVITNGGSYEVTTQPLADGVYDITAELEDLAGNVSSQSTPLRVTIANQSLTLPNGHVTGPTSDVTVDLETGRISGYVSPSVTGEIGIQGIPAVDLNLVGFELTILGTNGDDGLVYTPSGANSGMLTRSGSAQVLSFADVGASFTIAPALGSDIVTVNGTNSDDVITGLVDTDSTIQVNALLAVTMPAGSVEATQIVAGNGKDHVEITVLDTVSSYLIVDGGAPAVNKPNGDLLDVGGGSPQAMVKVQPGGPNAGSGSAFVSYPKTTGTETRVDFIDVEKVTKFK